MRYSLLLIETNPQTTSLAHSFNSDDYRVAQVFSDAEAEMWLAANVPDVVVVNLLQGGDIPPAIRDVPAAKEFSVPWVAVSTDGNDIPGCTVCTPDDLPEAVYDAAKNNGLLRAGPFALDVSRQSLWAQGETHHLTPKLTALMQLLLENIGQIVYRKEIMTHVWNTDYMGDTRTLDVHIRWLREIIEVNPSRPKYLLTVRGAGYRLIDTSAKSS